MTSTDQKTVRRQVRQLRADWKVWRHAVVQDPFRIEEFLICPVHRNAYRNGEPVLCGDPTCEGCMTTLYRADRMAEITAEAKRLVVNAADLACMALALLDSRTLDFHGRLVEGYAAEMRRRGEDHVQSCDLVGHLYNPTK